MKPRENGEPSGFGEDAGIFPELAVEVRLIESVLGPEDVVALAAEAWKLRREADRRRPVARFHQITQSR